MGNAFEELLAEAIAHRELGDEAALATLVAEHPEHADRLRLALERLGSMHLLSGGSTTSVGEFHLLQKLGGGGMGVVYLAEQTSLRRKVALKLVRPELLSSSVVRERFRREIETIAMLQHPGIAQVLAVGEQEGAPFFAMEYCPGCALGEVLENLSERAPENLRRSDFERAAGIDGGAAAHRGAAATWWHAVTTCIADVADTMAFVHEHRVIHRDLKPSNIIVTLQGRTKLLDFGLAHVATDPRLTQSGSEIGSPAYMAPEQLRGESVDERSDVYSLGVTLYQLLALRLPFRAKTPAALRAEIDLGDADPLARHAKAIPRELCVVVAQAMDRDPQRRYGSMGAFARDLRAVLTGEPILARSLGLAAQVRRWLRRHPLASGAFLLATALLVLTPLPLWLWQRSQSSRLDAALARAELDLAGAEAAIQRMLAHSAELDLSRVPAVQPLRLQLLGDAVSFYERMIERHPEEDRLKAAHAEQCWRFGLDLRVAGLFERAQEMFDRAERYYSSPSIPIDPHVYLQRVLAFKAAAQLARQRGELERSEDLLDRMNRACDSMLARWPDSFDAAVQRIESDNERAHVRHAQGRLEEQLSLQRATVAAKRALRVRHPEEQQTGMSLAMSCINCADVLCRRGDSLEEAQALYVEADELLEAAQFRPGDLFPSNLRGEAWLGLGLVARRSGRFEEARKILRRAEANQLELLRVHPRANVLLSPLFSIYLELARLELRCADLEACSRWLEETDRTLAMLRELDARDSFSAELVAERDRLVDELSTARGR